MILKVHDREDVEGNGIALAEEYVMISISCVNDAANIPKSNLCLDILRVEFDDIDRPLKWGTPERDAKLFGKEEANKILDFFDRWVGKVKYMIVHCDAGLSRSPGVAAALTKIQHRSDNDFFQRYLPNRRVYSLILHENYQRKGEL